MEFGSRDAFDRMGTLGIEEEFFIVDENGRPTSGIDDLVYGTDPPELIADSIDHELFACTIEVQTPLLDGPASARDTVVRVRDALLEHAHRHGYRIASAGLHPMARWRELEHAAKPRYRSQLERIQYPQHRNTTSGLHVHVGIDDPDKAMWITNELRWYVPIILALSANSPFWNGFDTGLASARAKVFENLPNTGIPSSFPDYDAYERFEQLMMDHGSIRDRGELWFDVRPHTQHGTVEVRAPDSQRDVERTLAFVTYVYELITNLADQYEAGHERTTVRREILDENKWRAIRHGHDASFISRDGGRLVDLTDVVDAECDRLGVSGIKDILEDGSGATRQRRIFEEQGVDALCSDLML